MHILIISGDGDIERYIYDTAIKMNFYVIKHLDTMHHSQIKEELRLIAEDAWIHLKGIAIITQRTEIIREIADYFQHNNRIEYIKVGCFATQTYNHHDLMLYLNNNWEVR